MITVEIACNGWVSCLNAVAGGAGRIELFENLADGGCTPSMGMISKVKELKIPCYVMIRPRGGDFCYSNDEIEIMLKDIEVCKKEKVAGIVFGCLTKTGEVDKDLNKKLLSAWNNRPATFHRAIDRSADIMRSAHVVTDLGFERILSSGGATNLMQGLDVLKRMQTDVGSKIIVMPGAGVTAQNAKDIIEYTKCKEIHATCKKNNSANSNNRQLKLGDDISVSDVNEITLLVRSLKTMVE